MDKKREAESIVYEDPDPLTGFIIIPDSKWDGKTISSVYLQALVHRRDVLSLRDIRPKHLPMLKKIKEEGERLVMERYGLGKGKVRLLVHYQPSYYHFHVHIVTIEASSFAGMIVGQSHLLEDIIDNLEMEGTIEDEDESYYSKKTFTYALGENHCLMSGLGK